MRLYSRQDFMKLPAGVIYAKGKEWYFGDLCVKSDTCIDRNSEPWDWYYHDLNWPDARDSEEAIARLEEMKSSGASYPFDTCCGRDGMYDDTDIFLVYEKTDLESLQEIAANALLACSKA